MHVVPVDATMVGYLLSHMILHMEAHSADFHLLYVEDLLLTLFRMLRFLDTEYSGNVFCRDVAVADVRLVLHYEGHLRVADIRFRQMYAFLSY